MILIEIFNILLIEFKRLVCQNGIDLLIDFFKSKLSFSMGPAIDSAIEFLIDFVIEFHG